MKTDSLNIQGSLKIERVDSLPVWDSSYTGRVLYSVADDKMYVGKVSGFAEAGGGGDNFGAFNWDPYEDGTMDIILNTDIVFQVSQHFVWEKLIVDGDVSRNWISSDISDNGLFIILAEENGRLYISPDNGVTWNETQPDGDNDRPWICVKCDGDGSNLIACYKADGMTTGKIFTSSNSGSSWVERQPAGAGFQDWRSVATDDTGSALLAASYGARLWYSANSGSSWTETRPLGDTNQNWENVVMDGSNSQRMTSVEDGALYYSRYGDIATWYPASVGGGEITDARWKIAISESSYMIVYVIDNGYMGWSYPIWSSDYNNWNLLSTYASDPATEFVVTINGSGHIMMIAGYGGGLYIGRRAWGILYKEYPSGVDANLNWKTISCSEDTTTVIAGCNPGDIYIARGGSYAAITPYDVIRAIRGGTPPYTYDIKLASGAYVGGDIDPQVPMVMQTTAASPSVTVKVTDSLDTVAEAYFYIRVQDPDSSSY